MNEKTENANAAREGTDGRMRGEGSRHGFILPWLDRTSAALYRVIGRSLLGRALTSYRRGRTALTSGESHEDGSAYAPLSEGRRRVVEAANGSPLLRGIGLLFRVLADCPVRIWGIFLALYGLLGVLAQAFLTPIWDRFSFDIDRTVTFTVLMLASIPFLVSGRPLGETLVRSTLCRTILCGFLGIPEDSFKSRVRVPYGVSVPVCVILSIGAAAAALWVNPALIPLIPLALGLVGLVLTFPEVGAVLSTLCLPFTWIGQQTLVFTAGLILLSWVGFGLACLRLRRSFRTGRLDAVFGLMMLVILLGGVFGTSFSFSALTQSLLAVILLSDYYLIVNMMNTRAYIVRCLIGVSLSVLFMTMLCFVRMIPVGLFGWLDDSAGFREIIGGFRSATDFLSGLWADNFELFLILMLPWLYAVLLRCRRVGQWFVMLVFLALDLWAVMLSGSVLAVIGVLIGFVLFFLMYSHRSLSVGVLLLPPAVCALGVYSYRHSLSSVVMAVTDVLSETTAFRTRVWGGVWRMILAYPAGIGLSEEAFRTVYPAFAEPGVSEAVSSGSLYLDMLVAFGWPGAAVMLVLVFLFVQKCLTALRLTSDGRDRALLLGGLGSFVSLLTLGFARSFAVIPKPAFIIALTVGICSAFANILFDEHEVLSAASADRADSTDRFYSAGDR